MEAEGRVPNDKDESHPIPVGLGVRKRKIDMTKIHTVGKDNLDSTFSGSTRSLLSSLGVKVLDSEEVERNIMDQAKSLSERSGPEYLELTELCSFSLPTTSLKNLNRLSMQYKDQLQKTSFSSQRLSSVMDDVSFVRLKLRVVLNEVEKREHKNAQKRLLSVSSTSEPKRPRTDVSNASSHSLHVARLFQKSLSSQKEVAATKQLDGGVEASSQEMEVPSQEKEVEKSEKEAEKEMPSQEKVMEVEEPVKEMEKPVKEVKKTARDNEKEVPRRKPTASEDDDLDVACPVCGEVFSAHTTLRQRTAHVEACLRRANPPDAPPAKPKKAEEEDGLWEEEETTSHAPAGERVDVGGVHGRRVIHDDGDDAYYRSLLSSYLEWRAAADSPAGEALCEQYHQTADSIYEWRACGQTPKAAAVQEALDRFYREEPAVLLPSGYAMPRHLWEVLYPYQRRGVEWVLGLHAQGVGGIVADEMGLGKTLQIVAALVALKFTQEAIRRGRNLSCLPKGEVEGADGGKDGGKSENESGGKSDIESGGKS
ncbi:hypothetical protein WA577_002509, partial [Blastocystis sp. JDR]